MKGWLKASIFVAVACGLAAFYFWPRRSEVVVDELCEFVQKNQIMNCVTTLADDTFVHPGSIIDYKATEKPLEDRLPLPVADVMGTGCLVPGQPELVSASQKRAGVSIPKFSYKTNGSLTAGALVELPILDGTNIKAGPEWSDIRNVDLSLDSAWITQIDENLAIDAVKSCSIKKSCVDRIVSKRYKVIATSLVGQGLSYSFYDSQGRVLSLDAAMKAKQLDATIGGSANVSTTTDATLKTTEPRVLGVRLFPDDIFANQPLCTQDVIYTADGRSTVSINGGGGRGNVGTPRTDTKLINQEASVAAQGREESECRSGFERVQSNASATARVEDGGNGNLRFIYEINAQGGHYVTAAGCAAGVVLGKTGHDTTAVASTELEGSVYVAVRSETAPRLQIQWSNMPSGASLRVLDWRNEPLKLAKTTAAAEGDLSQQGVSSYETRGPGTYRVEARVRLDASVGGNSRNGQKDTGDLTVSVVN